MGFFARLFGKEKQEAGLAIPGAEIAETPDPSDLPAGMEPLNSDQLAMIAEWLEGAGLFLQELGDGKQADELQAYDAAFAAWLSSGKPESERDYVISMLGAYLGHRLLTDYGMEWVLVRDQYGEEMGLRHPSLQIVAYPFDAVIKRINFGETGFIAAIHRAVGAAIAKEGVSKR